MKPVILLLLLPAALSHGRAQETNTAPATDYSSFRLVTERNIFNPNRSARPARSGRGAPERQVRIESFALVGTLSYEKGSFAFFDGSSSQYRQVLKPADKIAGCTLICIGPDSVRLETGGREIELRVGMQLRREDEGQWQVTARTEPSRSTSGPPASAEASAAVEKAGAGSESGPGNEENDVLKRLMQKREQEIKNEKPE